MSREQESPLALLLDDNLMSTMRVQPQLERMGYRVRTARTVPEVAADETAAETPQLVLINLGSRNLNGVSLVKIGKERYPAARVIGFCGHLETEIRRAARAAGIDRILTNDQALSDLERTLSPKRPEN
ncbi:MAG: response regulator [Armatimonadota bacterium]|nr:response regulator [Armatimonadota bacterium]